MSKERGNIIGAGYECAKHAADEKGKNFHGFYKGSFALVNTNASGFPKDSNLRGRCPDWKTAQKFASSGGSLRI